jgi:hypothetical protein
LIRTIKSPIIKKTEIFQSIWIIIFCLISKQTSRYQNKMSNVKKLEIVKLSYRHKNLVHAEKPVTKCVGYQYYRLDIHTLIAWYVMQQMSHKSMHLLRLCVHCMHIVFSENGEEKKRVQIDFSQGFDKIPLLIIHNSIWSSVNKEIIYYVYICNFFYMHVHKMLHQTK